MRRASPFILSRIEGLNGFRGLFLGTQLHRFDLTIVASHSCTFGLLFTNHSRSLSGTIHNLADYFKLGKFVAAHGLKGELLLKHELRKKSALKGLKTIFIEQSKNSFLPWFIASTKIKNDEEVYVKLDGVDTREVAAGLTRKEVWLTEQDFKKHAAKSSPANLLGYTIINDKKSLGEIIEVIEQPHQLLCRIEINQKEALIPLNEDTLKKIDHKNKEVIVNLPEGLLDIYIEL